MLKVFFLACFTVNALVDSIPLDDSVIEGHIIGGNDTDISHVPYQVALYENNKFICGGFIVSPTFVVTASQCVYKIKNGTVTIRAGSSSHRDGGVIVEAKKFEVNPKFNGTSKDYDVAVIELATALKLNDNTIKSVKLATKEPNQGSWVLASGWGFTSEKLEEPKTLQSVMIPIFDTKTCAKTYKKYDLTVTPRMICAGSEGKTAYSKDVGGPLVFKDEVVGIASFGIGCGHKGHPGVYTNIANPEITKFIKDIAKL